MVRQFQPQVSPVRHSFPDAALGELSQESLCASLDLPILAVTHGPYLLGDPLRGNILP